MFDGEPYMARIKRLEIALDIKTEEHKCCAEDLMALRSSEQTGWKEAAIAWEVCASIHEKFAKGKDALYSTRHADFEKHAEDARRKLTPNARSEARPVGASRSTEELYPDGGNGMNRKLDVVTMTGEEYDALRDEIDELRKRLSQKMDDCVKAEQRQKKDAETYWTARESLVSRIERLHEALQKIAAADWKEWQELASAEEFVRWAKSRALHALVENASVEGNNVEFSGTPAALSPEAPLERRVGGVP